MSKSGDRPLDQLYFNLGVNKDNQEGLSNLYISDLYSEILTPYCEKISEKNGILPSRIVIGVVISYLHSRIEVTSPQSKDWHEVNMLWIYFIGRDLETYVCLTCGTSSSILPSKTDRGHVMTADGLFT